MADDYLELNAFSHYDEDERLDLWVSTKGGDTIVCHNSTSAVRYQGWWSVNHKIADFIDATAYIPADSVQYFNLIHRRNNAKDEDQ